MKLGVRLFLTWLFWSIVVIPALAQNNGIAVEAQTVILTEAERKWLREHPVWKIGVDPDSQPYDYINNNGQHAGIASDYLKLIAKTLNVRIEVVPGLTWPQVLKQAQTRQLDVLAMASITKSREAYLAFSAPYLKYSSVIITRQAQELPDVSALSGKQVALVRSYVMTERTLAENNSIRPVFVDDIVAGLSAVSTGNADAMVIDIASAIYKMREFGFTNLKIGGFTGFDSPGYSVAVRKDWAPLLPIIDKVLAAVSDSKKQKINHHWLNFEIPEKPARRIELTAKQNAWLMQHPVIRVQNESDSAPYNFNDGQPKGYSIDYLQLLAKKLGIRFEYVSGASFSEFLDMVKNKQLDMMVNVVDTPKRREYMLFTGHYQRLLQGIYIKKGQKKYTSLNALKGKKLAAVKGYYYQSLLEQHFPLIELDLVKDDLEGIESVLSGKSDALINDTAFIRFYEKNNSIGGLELAGIIRDAPFENLLSLGVRQDWPVLTEILQKAMDTVTPGEQQKLNNKWNSDSVGAERNSSDLSPEELAWLKNHPVIRVQNEFDYAPYNYNDGEAKGYSIDYMRLLGQKLGIRFEFVSGPSFGDFLTMIADKKLDVMVNVVDTPQRRKFMKFTRPYQRPLAGIYVKSGQRKFRSLKDMAGHRLAVIEGFYYQKLLVAHYSNIKLVLVKDNLAAIEALLSGKADGMLADSALINHFERSRSISGLEYSAPYQDERFNNNLSLGVRNDWQLFRDILHKSIATVSTKELKTLHDKWIANHTVSDWMRHNLSPTELDWLREHPVIRVHNEQNWPPYNFNRNGNPLGYSIDLMNRLAQQLNLEVDYVSGPSWSEFMAMVKNKEIDVMLNIVAAQDRKAFIDFTRPYQRLSGGIWVRSDAPGYKSLQALAGKKVSYPTGFNQSSLLSTRYPDIIQHPVKDDLNAIRAVLSGDADAYYGDIGVTQYLLSENRISTLRLAARVEDLGVEDQLSIGIRKDWKPLTGILNKAMKTIPKEELLLLENRWLVAPAIDSYDDSNNRLYKPTVGNILFVVLLVVLLSLAIWWLVKTLEDSKRNPLKFQFTSRTGKRAALAFNAVLVLVAVSLSWMALQKIEQKIKADNHQSLQTVLQTTHEALQIWLKEKSHSLQTIAADPRLLKLVQKQLQHYNTDQNYRSSKAQAQVRAFFDNYQLKAYQKGVYLIALDGINIASFRPQSLGSQNVIAKRHPDIFARVLTGETLWIPPIESDMSLDYQARVANSTASPAMFFATVIYDKTKRPLAVLALQYNPNAQLSNITRLGRLGESGETYLFDNKAKLLTDSRFTGQLKKIGMIGNDEQAILSIVIRDPGVNLMHEDNLGAVRNKLSFTAMAESAIAGVNGFNVDGYRDYRGVTVIGSWLWDDRLGIGMTTEIDFREAMSSYAVARAIIIFIVVITVALSMLFTVFTMILGSRANQQLFEARDQLENRVEQRTYELGQSEKRLQQVMDSVPAVVYLKDRSGRYLYVNTKYEEVVGLSRETVMGKTDKDVMPAAVAEDLMAKDRQVMSDNRGYQMEESVPHPDGTLHEYWSSKVPTSFEKGEVSGILAVSVDISERKLIEQELEMAKDKAETANKAKSAFLANMSHEIRTPMNAILGYAQLLERDESLATEQRKVINTVSRSGEHLLALINDILDMSKIEAGQLALNETAFNLPAMLDDIRHMLDIKCRQKHIDFEMTLAPNVPQWVAGDEAKLRQILINLTGNAIKFTERGLVRLETDIVNQRGTQLQLQFKVIDTGIGIAQDKIRTIFDAFSQIKASQHLGGTGLGLAIARRIAQIMGGTITVTSTLGEGTVFTATVNLKTADNVATDKMAAQQATSKILSVNNQPGVLVVDDEPINRELLNNVLTSYGFDVMLAASGPEGIELFKQYAPGIVLMDYVMPDMDGIEATQVIRNLPRGKETLVISVTANALADEVKLLLNSGVDKVVNKPLNIDLLIETIVELADLAVEYQTAEPIPQEVTLEPESVVKNMPEALCNQIVAALRVGKISQLRSLHTEVSQWHDEFGCWYGQMLQEFKLNELKKVFIES